MRRFSFSSDPFIFAKGFKDRFALVPDGLEFIEFVTLEQVYTFGKGVNKQLILEILFLEEFILLPIGLYFVMLFVFIFETDIFESNQSAIELLDFEFILVFDLLTMMQVLL